MFVYRRYKNEPIGQSTITAGKMNAVIILVLGLIACSNLRMVDGNGCKYVSNYQWFGIRATNLLASFHAKTSSVMYQTQFV